MPKVSAQYRDERRAHILAAARRCFVRDGFHQTSMQDLVREAGMSSGAVYRYFDSKDAMILAIAEENLDEIAAIALVVWSEALRNPALAARLRESFDAAGEALAETARTSSTSDTKLA